MATVTVPDTTAETDRPGTTETIAVPDIDTEPFTVTVPDTRADPVRETTVVPAPAVTVPVMTTGKAVVLWPPPTQMTTPVAEIDGAVVTLLKFETLTVPLTTADTESPGTTETICVPRIVTIVLTVAKVCPAPSQTIGPVAPLVAVVV